VTLTFDLLLWKVLVPSWQFV